jgi:N-acetylmuramoyl-L-alanine amidase
VSKKLLWKTLLMLTILAGSVFPTSFHVHAETETATVLGSSVNIRTGPGLSYPVQSSAKYGETYEIIDSQGDWVKIKLKNGASGWIADWLVSKKTLPSSDESLGEVSSIATGLRIRSGPGTSFQIIGKFNKGEKAKALLKQGNWVKISYKGTTGWVYGSYIAFSKSSKNHSTNPKTGTILANALNVRTKPTTKSSIIGKLYKNEQVSIVNQQGDWYQIQYKNQTAWVHKDFVKTATSSSNSTTGSVKTGVVTASALNVRDQSSLNGKIIGSVKKGTKVSILNEVNNWYEIKLDHQRTGWIAGWYVSLEEQSKSTVQTVTLLYNGTNLRSGPSTSYKVIARGNKGDQFSVTEKVGQWYKIQLAHHREAYVAGWIVTTGDNTQDFNNQRNQPLQNKKIILDPGHGGYDSGTIGSKGTLEKHLTLKTAKLLYQKLNATGAKVTLTRSDDTYISLNSRVYMSNYHKADAFISIHYDSSIYTSASGLTAYYYHSSKDKKLASTIHQQLVKNTKLRDRGVKYGNFHVLRENSRPATLLELGFLSNPTEEWTVTTNAYQEQATQAIYNGLVQYFQ